MGGGFIQLVAYGAQDIYLTGNPQITFFKYVYRRHTNFALENINQFPIGQIKWGNKLIFNIERKGDLLGKCYIDFYIEFKNDNKTLNLSEIKEEAFYKNSSIAKSLGHSFIDFVEIDIGGQLIDHHSGQWLAIKSELSQNFNKRLQEVLLNGPFNNAYHLGDNVIHISVPLKFWFNSDPGLYLPLVSLQHHDVKVILKLNHKNKFILSKNVAKRTNNVVDIVIKDLNLHCDYVYLDTEERKKFAQVCHEYLIEQVQEHPGEYCQPSINQKVIPLNLNHPVKELIWTVNNSKLAEQYGPYWSNGAEKIKTCLIQMNGVDRLPEKSGNYFRLIQKYQHHNGIDLRSFIKNLVSPLFNNSTSISNDLPITQLDIFSYSFALKPDELQPSGSCNFSRLDNAILKISFQNNSEDNDSFNVRVFATNYNVLRIKAGMGGLAYSN